MISDGEAAEKHEIAPGRSGVLRCLAPLALAPLVSGCAAAFVAPVVLAGGAITQAGKSDNDRDAEAQVAAPSPSIDRQQDQVAQVTVVPEANSVPSAQLAAVTVPQPAVSAPLAPASPAAVPLAVGEWQQFIDFALARSQAMGGPMPVPSALLVPDPPLDEPDTLPCESTAPAVIVDLDQGRTAFHPVAGMHAPAGLGPALERLRDGGVVVMWLSDADVNSVTQIGAALRESGLDPWGRDPLLLAKPNGDRKQLVRISANESACVIAIAGDRRSDFDELFDYLRVPASAAGLDAMLGDGWFVVPPPLEAAQ